MSPWLHRRSQTILGSWRRWHLHRFTIDRFWTATGQSAQNRQKSIGIWKWKFHPKSAIFHIQSEMSLQDRFFCFYKRCQGCVQQIYGVWVFGMQTRNCNGVIKFCIFSGAARKSSDWVPDYDPQAFLINFLKNLLASFFIYIRTT